MEPKNVFFKELGLIEQHRFILHVGQNNNIEQVCFSPNEKYFITNLKLDVKLEADIEEWNDYTKIDELSEFC